MIQAAYEVLSDESERRWYDTHREEILFQNSKSGSSKTSFTTIAVEELMGFFDPTISKKMDDSSEVQEQGKISHFLMKYRVFIQR